MIQLRHQVYALLFSYRDVLLVVVVGILRCPGCHNPESWDFDGGKEFTPEILDEIISGLTANNINRTLCIMGGEPLCSENLFLTTLIIKEVRQ